MARAKKSADPIDDVDLMFENPGFLIRRAQQIAVSSFVEHYGHTGVTPTQAGILKAVQRWPGIDQVSVGRVLGLDRTTAATSIATLAKEKLLVRRRDPIDKRRRTLFVTPAAEAIVAAVGDTRASATAMLSAFSPADAKTFVRLLQHFVRTWNDAVRIPMETAAPKRRTVATPPQPKARAKKRSI